MFNFSKENFCIAGAVILLIGACVLIAFLAAKYPGNYAARPQQYTWDDPQPVNYPNADDNTEIEIDFDGYKRKVKKGDYRTGRYKNFTRRQTSNNSSSFSIFGKTSPSASKPDSGKSSPLIKTKTVTTTTKTTTVKRGVTTGKRK